MEYYLDNAATTKISNEALQTYCQSATSFYGNPSASNNCGFDAKRKLEECRNDLSTILGVKTQNIYFTSGGTESNSLVLSSLLWSKSPGEIIISKIEHASVSEFARVLQEKGWKVILIGAPKGFVKPETLEKLITEKTRMVCVQSVNNVTGSIQNIKELVKTVRNKEKEFKRKIHFHTDAVQALAKISFDLNDLDVDSASFSAHKFHGPRGVGFLYSRVISMQPLSKAGGQEVGFRGGTENLPSIAAMVAALKQLIEKTSANANYYNHVNSLNSYLRDNLHPQVISPSGDYSPFILTISVAPFPSEVFTRMLNDEGFYVSSGSACSNNVKAKGENILVAMNVPSKIAKGSIRISFSDETTKLEVELLAKKINDLFDSVVR